jgi:Family of unknown function (DUF6152)
MMVILFRRCSLWVLLIVAGGAIGTAAAHHSFVATYDAGRQQQIEGEVAQFLFRNPHSMVHILAPDENGDMQRWAIEWAGVNVLTGQGISRETLRIGDGVIVTGNPGRVEADHRMRMLSIERPIDGWKWRGTFE